MKLVIDRAKWLRGEDDASCLLRPNDGKMCCLGFFALACGLSSSDIHGRSSPLILNPQMRASFPAWLIEADPATGSSRVFAFTEPNDDPVMAEEGREMLIAAEFAKHGVEVEFIGDALKAPTDSMSVHDPSTDDRIE